MPFPKKVLLIINPIAGDTDKTQLSELLYRRAATLGFQYEVYTTTGKDDPAAVKKVIQNFNPDRVLVAGGDGTITQMANVVRAFKISMGIIPMGSANGLATSLGLPFELSEALEVALGNTLRTLDGMLINDQLGLHLSDIGLNARLIKNYEQGTIRGKWGYLAQVAQTLSEHDNFTARITTDDGELTTEATMIILANANMYGTGVNVNPKGCMSDGRFEIIIATRFDLIELAKVVAGNIDLDPKIVQTISTTHAQIECLTGEALFQIDGEFKGIVNQVDAYILPGVLTIAISKK